MKLPILVTAILLCAACHESVFSASAKNEKQSHAPDEIIIKFKATDAAGPEQNRFSNHGASKLAAKLKEEAGRDQDLKINGSALRQIPDLPDTIKLLLRGDSTLEPVYRHIHRQMRSRGISEEELTREKSAKHPSPHPKQNFNLSNIYILRKIDTRGKPVTEIAQQLAQDPRIEYAEPNYFAELYAFPQTLPNDTFLDPDQNGSWSANAWGQPWEDLWGLKKIGADKAWAVSQGEGVVVATVDTGFDPTHEDLADRLWTNPGEIPGNGIDDDGNGFVDDVHGWDLFDETGMITDPNGHGSHVAGTIAATGNNGRGVIGVAPKATIMPVACLAANGSAPAWILANGLVYAADNGARVINNSWGGPDNQVVREAVAYAYARNCVITASAGNSADDARYFSPANIPEVLTVAASDPDDRATYFSNFGNVIDVAAPGGGTDSASVNNILSTLPDNSISAIPSKRVAPGYYRLAGTSMACPHVSGLAALILAKYPSFTNDQVMAAICASADDTGAPGIDIYAGCGRINAPAALAVTDPLDITAALMSPDRDSLVRQGRIRIQGSAAGASFSSYQLFYCTSPYDAASLQTWYAMTGPLTTPVIDGLLCEWDTSSLNPGAYAVKLVVNAESMRFAKTLLTSFEIVDDYFLPGWPRNLVPEATNWLSEISVVDVDGDGRKETLGLYYGSDSVFLVSADCTPFPGWPLKTAAPLKCQRPAAGDVNHDGRSEIFFNTYDRFSNITSLHGYSICDQGGALRPTPLPGWPRTMTNTNEIFEGANLAITDIDGDGEQEIIAATLAAIEAFAGDGSLKWRTNIGGGGWTHPLAIGDLDKDGKKEIVFGIDFNLYVLDCRGNVRLHKQIFDTSTEAAINNSDLILADLNRDGMPEIVTISAVGTGNPIILRSTIMTVMDRNGEPLNAGWPKEYLWEIAGNICAGNIDADPELELICPFYVQSSSATVLRAFNADGTSTHSAPAQFPDQRFIAQPLVADRADGSGADILLLGQTNHDGGPVYQYTVDGKTGTLRQTTRVRQSLFAPPYWMSGAWDDINNDGITDMVVQNFDACLFAWSLRDRYTTNAPQWQMYQHDPQHTGNYDQRTPQVFDDGRATGMPFQLAAFWRNADAAFPAAEYQYAIGTRPAGTDVCGWTSAGTSTAAVRTSLSLRTGTTYYVAVKARDARGQWSPAGCSDGIIVDLSAPSVPIVRDEGTLSRSLDSLSASWTSTDAESGIAEYAYAVGTAKGGSDVAPWTSAGTATATVITNLALQAGRSYYISVRSRNGVGIWSPFGCSDGIIANSSPQIESLSPGQVFTAPDKTVLFKATYRDEDGAADLKRVYLLVNTSSGGANCCFAMYDTVSKLLYLRKDDNTLWTSTGAAIGSNTILENSYARLDCARSTVTVSTASICVTWAVSFKPAFKSDLVKNTYLYAIDGRNVATTWILKGNVLLGTNYRPETGAVTPESGAGCYDVPVSFTAGYSDINGVQNLQGAYFLINSTISGANCCFTFYDPAGNKIYLRNSANTVWLGGCAPGSDVTVSNGYASLHGKSSAVKQSSTTLTVTWTVSFSPAFAGDKQLYLYAKDDFNLVQNWAPKGTWTVLASSNSAPIIGFCSQNGNTIRTDDPSNPFRLVSVTQDRNGWDDIRSVWVLVSTATDAHRPLYARYDRDTNKVYLRNDADTAWLGGCAPGSNATISNSRVTLDCRQMTVSSSTVLQPPALQVAWYFFFKPGSEGSRDLYIHAVDRGGLDSGWDRISRLSIVGSSPAGTPELRKTYSVTPGDKVFVTPWTKAIWQGTSELTVFDVRGALITRLQSSGTIAWDGRDDAGRLVESGLYIYRSKKMDGRDVYGVVVVAK